MIVSVCLFPVFKNKSKKKIVFFSFLNNKNKNIVMASKVLSENKNKEKNCVVSIDFCGWRGLVIFVLILLSVRVIEAVDCAAHSPTESDNFWYVL